ncbi:MAG: N-6 DNA methylase [Alphaproteobacteria bacterium]|nr:N-6 DNA methylase [Alphaproteobacteria bacterium]
MADDSNPMDRATTHLRRETAAGILAPMDHAWRRDHLPELLASPAARPGHEQVRVGLAAILHHAFGAAYLAIDQEVRLPEVRGRADTLFGATVFELKSDLRRKTGDVLARLPDYLAERGRLTGRPYIGVATDGATFVAYALRDGELVEISRHQLRPDDGDALLAWLEPALSNRDELLPEPLVFRRELGRESLTYGRAKVGLEQLWRVLQSNPEVALKRQLWDGLLREAYGATVGDDTLFLQHTYLTIVAKTLAARVLDLPADDAGAILSGEALADVGIHGAVESDFFDWVLLDDTGRDLVRRIARQVARFRLRDVEVDVLKALYESLIDPAQRHDLGEYYTPDWLAAKIVRASIANPLAETVLDPACGSGTFLFHAIRRLAAAARDAGWEAARTVRAAEAQVRGLDIHPVAIIIARVTWLLALGEAIRDRDGPLHVPVYLGDAMQWNLSETVDVREVMVPVPGEEPLHVPAGFAEDRAKFDPGLHELAEGLETEAPPDQVERALARIPGVTQQDAAALAATFARLVGLKRDGRNGIWPFILRNLIRPIWLSRPDQRADVLLGNPPWVAYRHLSAEMKPRMRDACRRMNLWVGGVLATQQDLSALFWARGAERYLRPGGAIAFVLPYAALNRSAFAGLRAGEYQTASVRITGAWSLELVRPLFPTSACVLFGRREVPGPLPRQVERFTGTLPERDAGEAPADRALIRETADWPLMAGRQGASVYRDRFRNGASIWPRRFFLVEREIAGRLGASRQAPRVRGREGPLDKKPWVSVAPPAGPVEAQFLRPLLLGENLAPFRLIGETLAVIPVDGMSLLDSSGAGLAGHRHLAAWLRDIETKWAAHASRSATGGPRMTLVQQIDHMRKLSHQFASPGPKIAYTKAGTLLSAAIVENGDIVIDHKAYWAPVRGTDEARYLCALINSETVLRRVIPMQSRGWRDPRDFDKLVWELPIPEFSPREPLHRELAAAAEEAERVAAAVALPEGDYRRKRRAIRDALAAAGLTVRMEALVGRLLPE